MNDKRSTFFFDASTLEHKRANEKRELVYEFTGKREDGVLVFATAYSEKGRKTKLDDIMRALHKLGVEVKEEAVERAFRVFERQSEVDYFINKNARAFLREQFDLWLFQYVFSGESEWTEQRIKQLQVLKDIALKVIDFISQFEDELVKIWNKPKFVLNSNYIIALDADRRVGLFLNGPAEPGSQTRILLRAQHPSYSPQLQRRRGKVLPLTTAEPGNICDLTQTGAEVSSMSMESRRLLFKIWNEAVTLHVLRTVIQRRFHQNIRERPNSLACAFVGCRVFEVSIE